MEKYEFQILQYQHDAVTGEFVNVGVVVYSAVDKFLAMKVLVDCKRVIDFFGGIDGFFLQKKIKEISEAVQRISHPYLPDTSLDKLTSQVLNYDDGSFSFSLSKNGIDTSLETALEDIFGRFVGKYCTNNSKTSSKKTLENILVY